MRGYEREGSFAPLICERKRGVKKRGGKKEDLKEKAFLYSPVIRRKEKGEGRWKGKEREKKES